METTHIEVNIRSAGYPKKTILENIQFSLPKGAFCAVIGRNGSGKSTLLSCLCGLLSYRGSATVEHEELAKLRPRARAQRVGVLLQQPRLPHITVEELLRFGRNPYHDFGERMTSADTEKIECAIQKANLENLRHCFLDRISGGETRRAYLGLLLAQDTPLFLLDEATAFMDTDHEAAFLELLSTLCHIDSKTVISVMHNLEHAMEYADRILLLNEGKQLFFGSPRQLLDSGMIEPIFHVKAYHVKDGEKDKIFFSST